MITYNILTDITAAKVSLDRLKGEIDSSSIQKILESLNLDGSSLSVIFSSELSGSEKTLLDAILLNHSGEPIPEETTPQEVNINTQPAFSSAQLDDGAVLYLKIHGMKANIPANSSHEFLFSVPYGEVYMQGLEIFVDILSQTDMTIKHPLAGVLEQYGYNVCTGKIIYKRQADYAARLPMGIQISAVCTNTEPVEQEMGVNFILHEIRYPAV